MALEKKLESVPPILFTSNGTMFGVITVADTAGFRTKQIVAVSNGSSNPQSFQVKRVLSSTQLIVGPKDNKITINDYSDVSAYTVASGAIIFAAEQDKPGIPPDPHYFAVYESDPVVADRVVQVNKYGQIYDSVTGVDGKNRLAVDAAVTVTGVTVDLDAFTKIPPDNAISVGTEDGTLTGVKHAQKISSDGNLNVKDIAAEASLASLDSKMIDLNTTPVKTIQIFTKPFKAITRIYPDPSVGVEVYQSRLVDDLGPIQETATVTYADGAAKQEFLKVVVA